VKAAVAMLLKASVPSFEILSNVLSEKLLSVMGSVKILSSVLSEKLLSIMHSLNYCPACSVKTIVHYAQCRTIVQCAQ